MDENKIERDFNSIKVQLEQTLVTDDDNLYVFQFHKGTIRTKGQKNSESRQNISIP